MLQVNKTLRYLEISENCIKDDEMSALACSIQASTTLRLGDTRYKAHEFTNKTLRLIRETYHSSNISQGYLDAVFSSEEMDFEGSKFTTRVYTILLFFNCRMVYLFVTPLLA